MPRLDEGWREKYRWLLARVRPRRLEFGADLLARRARETSAREGVPLARAYADLYDLTRQRVDRRVALTGACAVPVGEAPRRFLCDGSLGGLARWLRAAGYEAEWPARARGDALVAEAAGHGATLVTTDHRLLLRRDVREGRAHVVWVPSGMPRVLQLRMVLRDLGLGLREPRCMACGGALAPVGKDAVRERIPPRTARWRDEYFVCSACGQLFWQGTHWERIARRLAEAP